MLLASDDLLFPLSDPSTGARAQGRVPKGWLSKSKRIHSLGRSLSRSVGRSFLPSFLPSLGRRLLLVFPLTNAQLDLTKRKMSSNGSANVKKHSEIIMR